MGLFNNLIKLREHSNTGKVFPVKSIDGKLKRVLKWADIVDFTLHCTRHTFASHLVMNGVDLITVKELLGHKTMKMTLRYAHLSQDHKVKAVGGISQMIIPILSRKENIESIEKALQDVPS